MKTIFLLLIVLIGSSVIAQNEKVIISLDECAEIVDKNEDVKGSNGENYYSVYINNRCDKDIVVSISTTGKDGFKTKCCVEVRKRKAGDKEHVARASMSSTSGKFKLETTKLRLE